MKKIGTALNLVSATDFNNSTQSGWAELETYATVSSATNGPDLVSAVTNRVFVPQTPETFAYDADGNLVEDGRFRYYWNGENRMIRAEEKMPPEGRAAHVIVYAYDHQGRNVAKDEALQIWDAYNIVVENAAASNVVINAWGLDIDGTMQGAGGVGGLLAVARGSDASLPLYDANGNITEYVDSLGGVESHTDYSAFGRGLMRNGMKSYSHGFSTKPWCRKSGLVVYQMRKYVPWQGRWITRDSIERLDELNLHGFVLNIPAENIDVLGNRRFSLVRKTGKSVGKIIQNRDPSFWEDWKSLLTDGLNQRDEDPIAASAKEAYQSCDQAKNAGECPKCCIVLAQPTFNGAYTVLSAETTESSCSEAAATGFMHRRGTFIQLLPMSR